MHPLYRAGQRDTCTVRSIPVVTRIGLQQLNDGFKTWYTCSTKHLSTTDDLWLKGLQRWENYDKYDFMESFEDFGLKIGIHSCHNEYRKISEYKRSRSFFDL